jgi:hypothetical protein
MRVRVRREFESTVWTCCNVDTQGVCVCEVHVLDHHDTNCKMAHDECARKLATHVQRHRRQDASERGA